MLLLGRAVLASGQAGEGAEAGAGGSMPSSICQVCVLVMAGPQGLPPGRAHFPSCLALTEAPMVKSSQLLLPPAFSPPVLFVVLLLAQGSL